MLKITKREILKTICFILLTAGILWYSSIVFSFPINGAGLVREKHNEWRALAEDSIDVLFVGSSAIDRFWIPALCWEKLGVTSFDYCSDGSQLYLTKYMIEEARKTQDPQIVVVDLRRAFYSESNFTSKRVRRVTSNLLSGSSKRAAIADTFDKAEKYLGEDSDIDSTDLSYQYEYLRNHNRWKNGITKEQLTNLFPQTTQRGFFSDMSFGVWTTCPVPTPTTTNKTKALSEYMETSLDELLDYCDTLDCKVVFLTTPMGYGTKAQARVNTAINKVRARGYDVINMNTSEAYAEMDLDFNTDYYNTGHTNFSGAAKATNYIIKYLDENYNLESHKADENYAAAWGSLYDKLVEQVKENRPEWLELL